MEIDDFLIQLVKYCNGQKGGVKLWQTVTFLNNLKTLWGSVAKIILLPF